MEVNILLKTDMYELFCFLNKTNISENTKARKKNKHDWKSYSRAFMLFCFAYFNLYRTIRDLQIFVHYAGSQLTKKY